MREVRRRAAPLADFVDAGTDAHAALTVLRLLRNTVHGAALHAVALEERMLPQQSLVEVPRADEPEVLSAMSALGGEAAWGVRRLHAGAVHVDPGLLVEALLPRVTALLNGVMQLIPLETLDGVRLTEADRLPPPPTSVRPGPWDEWQRLSVRWQLGF
jgi:hypothetical protein